MNDLTKNPAETAPAAQEKLTDIEGLKKQLEEEKAKSEKLLYNWQRSEADFSNYKKIHTQEQSEAIRFASSGFVLNLLPVLDDFERALSLTPKNITRIEWWQGLKMVYQKFLTTLQNLGLKEIKALGEGFNPGLHQAAGYSEGEEGKVIEVLQKGYLFQDKVLRAAIVTVGNGAAVAADKKQEETLEIIENKSSDITE